MDREGAHLDELCALEGRLLCIEDTRRVCDFEESLLRESSKCGDVTIRHFGNRWEAGSLFFKICPALHARCYFPVFVIPDASLVICVTLPHIPSLKTHFSPPATFPNCPVFRPLGVQSRAPSLMSSTFKFRMAHTVIIDAPSLVGGSG